MRPTATHDKAYVSFPPSLWAEFTATPPLAAPARGDLECDTVIVGAGFSGLSAALHLAEQGQRVLVLEARTVGWGASGRNNGQVIPTLSAIEPDGLRARFGAVGERFAHLVGGSADNLFDLIRRQNIAAEAEQTGWYQPAHSPGRLALSRARVAAWSALGYPARLIEPDESAALLGTRFWYGGMLNPTGGHVNPLALVRGLAQTACRAGAILHENSPVTGWSREDGRWLVRTKDATVRARHFLLMSNGYSDAVVPGFTGDLARQIAPITCWQVATAPLSDAMRAEIVPGRQAVSDTRGDLRFFRYDARNRLVTGGAVLGSWNAAERMARKAADALGEAFPALRSVEMTHRWNGILGMTSDRFPRIHNLGPDAWTWIGCNGRGVALGVALGKEIARAVSGEAIDTLALPLSEPKPIPFHGVVRRVAPLYLTHLQRKDRQEISA